MTTPSSDAAAAEPAELRGEPRWSSIRYAPHPRPAQWPRATDEKLVLLVTQSTASGERFPVGVNCACFAADYPALPPSWTQIYPATAEANVAALTHLLLTAGLEVSRVLRRSPVDCVKRFALLHDARERYDALQGEQQVEGKAEEDEAGALKDELEGALLDSEDDYLDEQVLSDFSTPVASPKLRALGTSGEFGDSGPASPGSPPPFAVARPAARQPGGAAASGGSPFRWESLVNDPNYTAPVLNSPPSLRHKQSFQDRFGLEDDEAKALSSASSPKLSPRGFMSPPRSQVVSALPVMC
ncbi:unnamed protein product [Phytophthora fragariaefolia]|uniref:Unnamed protein product n=1 Tax=Phytophthora fragariaefolia TaxID=1490495 RepID=A0A9W6XT12_9STRA|nr:unnamed protein product [Phytophthora fragariaefolia]